MKMMRKQMKQFDCVHEVGDTTRRAERSSAEARSRRRGARISHTPSRCLSTRRSHTHVQGGATSKTPISMKWVEARPAARTGVGWSRWISTLAMIRLCMRRPHRCWE